VARRKSVPGVFGTERFVRAPETPPGQVRLKIPWASLGVRPPLFPLRATETDFGIQCLISQSSDAKLNAGEGGRVRIVSSSRQCHFGIVHRGIWKVTMDDDHVDVIYCDGGSVWNHENYPGFKQESKILPQGSVHKAGARALPCDILWERDTAVKLRDGTTIYVDIFRPPVEGKTTAKVPVIICAGPFGKLEGFNRARFGEMPYRMGVPQCTVSSLEKFEGLDPAYWCLHGYAIAHPGEHLQGPRF
jgi:hypothetical protein